MPGNHRTLRHIAGFLEVGGHRIGLFCHMLCKLVTHLLVTGLDDEKALRTAIAASPERYVMRTKPNLRDQTEGEAYASKTSAAVMVSVLLANV